MTLNILTSKKASKLQGDITVPGDKSISHRALIFASQAIGTSRITGLLEGEDVLDTAKALRALGVSVRKCDDGSWGVDGVGVGGFSESNEILDMGNSGTGVRLMMGLVAPYPFSTIFTGDESLRKRPMNRVMNPLSEMGVEFSAREGGRLPLELKAGRDLLPIEYEVPVPSAQVKSAILLAGLNVAGKTKVIEREFTRDHTELMMKYFGVDIDVCETDKGREITLTGQPELVARDIKVPADPSSAAFVIAASLIVPDSEVIIRNICMNSARIGLFEVLKKMGADIKYLNEREEAGEKIADIQVRYSELNGIEVAENIAPSMIDEYPILAVIASFAHGKTVMKGLAELRVKECDRLSAMQEGLELCGVKCESDDSSLTVYGNGGKLVKGGAEIETHMDHRIAMSFLVMGMACKEPVSVVNGAVINTSFPDFTGLMNGLGGNIN